MIWWQWLCLSWLALGIVIIVIAELAGRTGNSSILLTRDDLLVSIATCAVLMVGAPLVALYGLCICLQMIYGGRIPISNHAWWPARASKFPDALTTHPPETGLSRTHESRETALCQMIELRHRKDFRLRQGKVPENWPMWMLWETTEAQMLDIVEQYFWLCDGGLTAQEALQKIDAAPSGSPVLGLTPNSTLRSCIAGRLAFYDPTYIALGAELLGQAAEIAETWSNAQIERSKADRPYPPKEWLKARVTPSEIEAEMSLPFRAGNPVVVSHDQVETPRTTVPIDRDWHRITLRMVPGDELWTFSSPAESWEGLAGRIGVALIRNGRPIGHVTSMMN